MIYGKTKYLNVIIWPENSVILWHFDLGFMNTLLFTYTLLIYPYMGLNIFIITSYSPYRSNVVLFIAYSPKGPVRAAVSL